MELGGGRGEPPPDFFFLRGGPLHIFGEGEHRVCVPPPPKWGGKIPPPPPLFCTKTGVLYSRELRPGWGVRGGLLGCPPRLVASPPKKNYVPRGSGRLLSAWRRMCQVREARWRQRYPHTSHLRARGGRQGGAAAPPHEKKSPRAPPQHVTHCRGVSPVCVRRCTSRWFLRLKALPQLSQVKSRTPGFILGGGKEFRVPSVSWGGRGGRGGAHRCG